MCTYMPAAVSSEAAYDSVRSVQRGRPEAVGDLPLQAWEHWGMGGHSKYNIPGGFLSSKYVSSQPQGRVASPEVSLLGLWMAVLPGFHSSLGVKRNQSPWTLATTVLIYSDRKLYIALEEAMPHGHKSN